MCWVVSGSVSVVFIFSFLNFGKKTSIKKLKWVEVSSFKQSGILTGKLTFFILPPYCTTAFSRSPHKKGWAQIFPAWCHPKRPCSKKTRLSFGWLYVLQLGSKPPYMKSEHKKQQKHSNIWFYETMLYIYTHIIYIYTYGLCGNSPNLTVSSIQIASCQVRRKPSCQVTTCRPPCERRKPTSDMNHESSWLVE